MKDSDLHQQIMNLRPPSDWDKKSALGTFSLTEAEKLAYKTGHRDARHAAAELVAASPAAAAGVPTEIPDEHESLIEMSESLLALAEAVIVAAVVDGRRPNKKNNEALAIAREDLLAAISRLAASPVAPAGAPTETDELLQQAVDALLACRHYVPYGGSSAKATEVIERIEAALLSRQGCELATAAKTSKDSQ